MAATTLAQVPAGKPQPAWAAPAEAGPEMHALRRFHVDIDWTGAIQAAANAPAMTARGAGRFRPILGGLWIVGDFVQDQFHEGRNVVTWRAHYIAGWSPTRKTYVAFAADSNGGAVSFSGEIAGDRFVILSDPMTVENVPVRLRMTWDATDPGAILWKNERSLAGGPWQLVEDYICTPIR